MEMPYFAIPRWQMRNAPPQPVLRGVSHFTLLTQQSTCGFRRGIRRASLQFAKVFAHQVQIAKHGEWNRLIVRAAYLQKDPDAMHMICRQCQFVPDCRVSGAVGTLPRWDFDDLLRVSRQIHIGIGAPRGIGGRSTPPLVHHKRQHCRSQNHQKDPVKRMCPSNYPKPFQSHAE